MMDKQAALEAVRQELFWTKVAEYIETKTAASFWGGVRGFGRSLLGGKTKAGLNEYARILKGTRILAGQEGSFTPQYFDRVYREARRAGLGPQHLERLLGQTGAPKERITEAVDALRRTILARRVMAAGVGGVALGGAGAAYGTSRND